jgi:hypothetical protein
MTTNEIHEKLERVLADARVTLRQRFRDWETPIDFDDLIARGVLRKTRDGYDVLKSDEMPRHAWSHVRTTSTARYKGRSVPRLQFHDMSSMLPKLRKQAGRRVLDFLAEDDHGAATSRR